jgi:hypothetical protein
MIAAIYDRTEPLTRDPERRRRVAASAVVRLLVRTGNSRAARELAAGEPTRTRPRPKPAVA